MMCKLLINIKACQKHILQKTSNETGLSMSQLIRAMIDSCLGHVRCERTYGRCSDYKCIYSELERGE